jgi:hypothetical protein
MQWLLKQEGEDLQRKSVLKRLDSFLRSPLSSPIFFTVLLFIFLYTLLSLPDTGLKQKVSSSYPITGGQRASIL